MKIHPELKDGPAAAARQVRSESGTPTRRRWLIALSCIIAAGVTSRVVHTGWIVTDKYLGDALYAAMIYAILRVLGRPKAALPAMAIMTALESFQLTLIPARLLASPHWAVRMAARLMGTEFSFLDLAAYAVGILIAEAAARRGSSSHTRAP